MIINRLLLLSSMLFTFGCSSMSNSDESNVGTDKSIWSQSESVEIRDGQIKGQKIGGAYSWLGLPFAKPPVGDLRWKAPRSPEPWTEAYLANSMPEACMQRFSSHTEGFQGSEDCLYLNVYRPDSEEANLPVYFYIHGGGNYTGRAAEYKGEIIAEKYNAVVVVTQYRLGWFGFFTHPLLMANPETPEDAAANYALQDQIKALQWVRDNITAFGGNPNLVTVAGQSAGALNISVLQGAEPVKQGNLFHGAVHQSGAGSSIYSRTLDNATAASEIALTAMLQDVTGEQKNLSDKEKRDFLFGVDAGVIATAILPKDGHFTSVIDGVIFKSNIREQFRDGSYHKVPMITGTTLDEFTLYLADFPNFAPLKKAAHAGESLDSADPAMVEFYRGLKDGVSRMWRAVSSDDFGALLSQHQDDVFVYNFNWDGVDGSLYQFVYGAPHGIEISFFHGHPYDDSRNSLDFTKENEPGRIALSDAAVAYHKQFIRTGNPGNGWGNTQPVTWSPWSAETNAPKIMVFDADDSKATLSMSQEILTAEQVSSENAAIEDEKLKQTLSKLLSGAGFEH